MCMEGLRIKDNEVKLSLFVDVMILYIETPKDSNKLLETMKNEGQKISVEARAGDSRGWCRTGFGNP